MESKRIAAEKAVEFVKEGMKVGLGTGSTAYWAIQAIGRRVKEEGLNIQAVATSVQSEQLAKEVGIPMMPFADVDVLDLTIDGADEVDPQLHLIKGGGGALLREKIVAAASKQLIIIVDESKDVKHLGKFPLPVEIVPFAFELTVKKLRKLGCEPKLRKNGEELYVTDNGNYIADCEFGVITDPEALHDDLNRIPGVVDNGLFIHMANLVIVGSADGSIRSITKE
ncbi:ribose-5-phosphate isomerase RpiA [Paenibacillus glycanilyticus]|uniref:ribose-5-phosphate isomerase RpiA n=1 Tax=Paenibacillus glycanilyticus TaxID=126569 RepID=UPI0020422360|nr:ribose-5-phosphate isomerase RpiA [Paenibacillus glycanilyticus]MCM3629923.1 ribose-5-phosphate isomerase RpiA [Paenibacillus glycanilyticus]